MPLMKGVAPEPEGLPKYADVCYMEWMDRGMKEPPGLKLKPHKGKQDRCRLGYVLANPNPTF